MVAHLEEMPNEVFEGIAVCLDLADICSLRVCSRVISAKATQEHFKSFFISKRVEVIESAFDDFVAATHNGGLGCLVQNLVLVGLADCTTDPAGPVDESEDTLTLTAALDAALRNVRKYRRRGQLQCLTLEVRVCYDGPAQRLLPSEAIIVTPRKELMRPSRETAKAVWRAAETLWDIAVNVLREAELPILALHAFDGPNMQACSLAAPQLNLPGLADGTYDATLSSLEVLSMSISSVWVPDYPVDELQYEEDDVEDPGPSEDEVAQEQARAEALSNYNGLANLLKHCLKLRDLDLHYFKMQPYHMFRDVSIDHERLFEQVALLDDLPRLQRCSLRGVIARENDLLTVVRRMRPRRLTFDNRSPGFRDIQTNPRLLLKRRSRPRGVALQRDLGAKP